MYNEPALHHGDGALCCFRSETKKELFECKSETLPSHEFVTLYQFVDSLSFPGMTEDDLQLKLEEEIISDSSNVKE